MPAAAVIPAPIAYMSFAVVKKLVVGFLTRCAYPSPFVGGCAMAAHRSSFARAAAPLVGLRLGSRTFTLKKLECSRQALRLNRPAWNNKIGLWFYFVGF